MKYKGYYHFDNRMSLKDVNEYVKNLDNHQYLPFITYKKDKNKWKNHKKLDEYRTISIPSIKDNYVYQYYNKILSVKYEEYIKDTVLDESVCAYRINQHKSNIDYFDEAYLFLTKCENAKIFIGDFSHFFDNLDHKILKDSLKEVMGVNELDDNMYKMLKSIEKASYIELDDILRFLNKKGIYIPTGDNKYQDVCNYCKKNNQSNIIKREWFKELKQNYLKPSKEELKNKKIGIVQGSSVSGVLANIYMIGFDKIINDILKDYEYVYKRYCDDFIIIVKDIDLNEYESIINKIYELSRLNKIELKKSKVQKFDFKNDKIKGINNDRDFFQFLGFTVHSKSIVKLRESTKNKQINKLLAGARDYHIKKKMLKGALSFLPDDENIILDKYLNKLSRKTKWKYYSKLKRVYDHDYKKSNFGTYMSRAIDIIKSEEIKKNKKDYVNLINKHIK